MGVDDADVARFQCPGEPYSIGWADHLGRLAGFYPFCKDCVHRYATGTLSVRQVRRLTDASAPSLSVGRRSTDGIVWTNSGRIADGDIRRIAMAMGRRLRGPDAGSPQSPTVVLGTHGRAPAAYMISPVGEGLRWAGCDVVDVGHVSAPCLVHAVGHLRADGGVYVGSDHVDPRLPRLSVWDHRAMPLSGDFSMSAAGDAARPVRKAGARRRAQTDAAYLSTFAEMFHALRPLRIVLHTGCAPLAGYLRRSARQVGCEMITDTNLRPLAKAEPFLADQVRRHRAHFGLWVDADGEVCRAVNERAILVPAEWLLLVLAGHQLTQRASGTIVLERDTPEWVGEAIMDVGGRVVPAAPARAEMAECLRGCDALLGGGTSGRVWLPSPAPSADGLRVLAMLLTILSTSDAPLSEVVDRGLQARAAGG